MYHADFYSWNLYDIEAALCLNGSCFISECYINAIWTYKNSQRVIAS